MCGITGFVGLENQQLLDAMCQSLRHRGPDDAGFFTAPGVGLAMRRLAIIDLATGHQPITNETKDVWVVFNGEIYNYDELAVNLKCRGHVFSTRTDTETIVHLYEEYGLDFVDHLRGMFGIALWDSVRQRLVLARDRLGEKPLFWMMEDGKLLFGSELKAILQYHRRRSVNARAVCEFLACGYVPPPRTFFNGICKLPPGHLLVYEQGRAEVRQYWQMNSEGRSNPPFDRAADELAGMMSEATRLCLKSDVEVGAFLSGGLDSSAIVALMREHNASVQTFSVGYGGRASGFNEFPFARRVAELLGTLHHELVLDAHSSAKLLPRIVWHFDEPLGEPTSVLVYLLCEFTRERVKVALGGTGGDELFFGYPRYAGVQLLQYYRMLPLWVRRSLVERLVSCWPESTRGSRFAKRVKRFVAGTRGSAGDTYLNWISLLDRKMRTSLASASIQNGSDDPLGDAFLCSHLAGVDDADLLSRATKIDVTLYLPEFQLTYMDRMSMAHGLEVRSPLCDYRLAEYATSLAPEYRLRGLHTKHILKKTARRWLPKDIVERRKVGFDSPIGQWLKEDLRAFAVGFLSEENLRRSGLLDPPTVQVLLSEHLSGRRDCSLQLWSLIVLEAWYRMYIEDGITDGSSYTLGNLRGGGMAACR